MEVPDLLLICGQKMHSHSGNFSRVDSGLPESLLLFKMKKSREKRETKSKQKQEKSKERHFQMKMSDL